MSEGGTGTDRERAGRQQQLQQHIESITRRLDEYEAEFQSKQDELRKERDAKIDGFRKDIINLSLSAEPEPPAAPPLATVFDGLVNLEEFRKFAEHPYFMHPGKKRGTIYVMVPKFYPSFQVGWLLDEVDGVWNRYEVNQYAVLFGSVPDEIREHLDMPEPIRATVKGSTVTFDPRRQKGSQAGTLSAHGRLDGGIGPHHKGQ